MEANQLQKDDTERKWQNMKENLLLKIFMGLNMVDMIIRVSGICQSWRKLSRDQCFWHTLDVDKLMDTFKEPENEEYYRAYDCDIMQILRSALVQSQKHVTTLISSTCPELDVSEWIFIAERTPMLKRLVMPLPKAKTLSGFCEAVKRWPLLESLTVTDVIKSQRLIKTIGKYCPNFSQLKVLSNIHKDFAISIITFMPNLKVLSLRGCFVYEEALNMILAQLEHLEVLNLSHCTLYNYAPRPGGRIYTLLPKRDDEMLEKTARLHRYGSCCLDVPCDKCEYVAKYYKSGMAKDEDYEPEFWKEDEVSTLSI